MNPLRSAFSIFNLIQSISFCWLRACLIRSFTNSLLLVYSFLAILEMLQQQMIKIQIGLGYNNFWISERNADDVETADEEDEG